MIVTPPVHTCPPTRPPGSNPGIVPPWLRCQCIVALDDPGVEQGVARGAVRFDERLPNGWAQRSQVVGVQVVELSDVLAAHQLRLFRATVQQHVPLRAVLGEPVDRAELDNDGGL